MKRIIATLYQARKDIVFLLFVILAIFGLYVLYYSNPQP